MAVSQLTVLLIIVGLMVLIFVVYRCVVFYVNVTPEIVSIDVVRTAVGVEGTPKESRRLGAAEEIVFDAYNVLEGSGEEECSICLEEYKSGETRATISTCNHSFHAFCIKTWLDKEDTCPLCRGHIV